MSIVIIGRRVKIYRITHFFAFFGVCVSAIINFIVQQLNLALRPVTVAECTVAGTFPNAYG